MVLLGDSCHNRYRILFFVQKIESKFRTILVGANSCIIIIAQKPSFVHNNNNNLENDAHCLLILVGAMITIERGIMANEWHT